MNSKLRIATFVALLVVISFQFVGCGSSDGTGAGTTDIRKIVSTGESLTFNNLTGGVNDLKVNPVTKLPAIAYYDKNAPISGMTAVGGLKYAYMTNNGSWVVEVVDANHGTTACGTALSFCVGAPNAAAGSTANILKLAFKSDGTPAIAYVFGPSVGGAGNKQIRYAERSSAGVWSTSVAYAISTAVAVTNVAVAATVDPMKGVTLNFDSSNRPHITFGLYTQTLTNSSLQYLFRDSGGTWNSNTILAGLVTGAGAIAGLGQGMNQAGAVMCPTSDTLVGTAHLTDGAAGAGNPVYFRCSAVGANGGCSTWSTQDMIIGCTGATSCFSGTLLTTSVAGARTDITIDPVTNVPVIGIYSTTTPANSLLTIALPNSCAVAQPVGAGSWGAPVTVGAASQGLNGFRLAASSSNYFISYLTLTTSSMLNVFNAGTWLATGHLVETVTVAGEGVGLDYDSSNDMLYTSYAALPAAAAGAFGNDVKVGYSRPGELTSGGATGTLPIDIIDTLVTAFPTAAVPMLTAAKAPNGTIGYAYFFQDATVASSKLYYGVRSGTSTDPVFSQRTVTNYANGAASPQFVGSYPSLAYDANSNPVLAFYNGITGQNQLIVALSANGGTSFSLTVVDDSVADVGQFPSVAVSGSSIAIAYYDVTNTGLKLARFTPGKGWRRFSVDGLAGTGSCGNPADDAGRYARLHFTAAGTPVIAYQSNGVTLKMASAPEAITSNTFTWTCGVADASAAQRGEGIDLVLDSSDRPHVVHFDATAGNVRYTTCSSAASTCIAAGPLNFTSSIIGASGTTSTIVTRPSLQRSSDGTLFAAFHSASYQALVLATLTSGASAWDTEFLDQVISGSSFISTAGQYGQLLLNDSGYPLAFYRSNENWLKYFSREPN
jgi:trimeric autotransporter adhesin